jgi:serine/threonine-protein kinase
MGLLIAQTPDAPSVDVPAGQISAQVPKKGEKIAKGDTITVTISKGQVHTLIPSIYGKDLATVKERLEKAGMVVGKVSGNTKRTLRKAFIGGKQVRNFSRVIVGETVDLEFP